jgi:hypothetical protein
MIGRRDVINGKAATLTKFSDALTLSQPWGTDYAQPLALPHLKYFVITPLGKHNLPPLPALVETGSIDLSKFGGGHSCTRLQTYLDLLI